jgi:serine/threonine protein kinase
MASDLVPWPDGEPFLEVPTSHYRLVEQQTSSNAAGPRWIAQGGQGAVYAASSRILSHQQYAIKFPRCERWDSQDHLDAFLQEAELGLLVGGSPSLARTICVVNLESYRKDGWPPWAMVMEYFPCTLAQVRRLCKERNRPLPRRQVIRWAEQLLAGLSHLHNRLGLVHRDIKDTNIMFRLPSNRFFADDPEALLDAEAVLTDFGTVCRVNEICRWRVVRRDNDRWKDPELYTTNQIGDPAMDMYAFGEVLRVLDRLWR